MVLVNGNEIKIYELDTEESVMVRIASKLNTLPIYLYFPEKPKNILEGSYEVVDLLEEIKENAKENLTIDNLLSSLKNKLPPNYNVTKNIVYVWLAYNNGLKQIAEYTSIDIVPEALELVEKDFFSDEDDLKGFWLKIPNIILELDLRIKNVKDTDLQTKKMYKILDDIENGMVYTDFLIDKMTVTVFLNVKNTSLLEIFNSIATKPEYPYISCNNYFKVLKDFIPNEEWVNSEESTIIMKVASKANTKSENNKDYVDVYIKVEGELGEENVYAKMDLITTKSYLSKDKFIERFSSGVNLPIKNTTETDVVGIFYFPQIRIDTYVLSDLIMNDPIFSNLINVDESNKATKKKTTTGQSWLHIHFYHETTGRISAGITQKIIDRSDPELRDTDPEIFPHNEPCVRVRLKGRNRRSVEIFQLIFSKLLVIYTNKYKEIVKIYKQFLPNFGKVEELQLPEKKDRVETQAPEIFVKKYTRNCTEARMPKIIKESEVKEYEDKGQKVMAYPRKELKSGPVYSSDGKQQKYFICPNPKYPFPGVQLNKLENAEDYPFVPCCFANDHSIKKGGLYRHYFFGEPLESKEKKQQDLIITDKILGMNKFGVLPDELEKLFSIIDSSTDYKYIRFGVNREDVNKSSFLECVMIATQTEKVIDLDKENRLKLLEKTRRNLSLLENVSLCRQNYYENTPEYISEEIKNPDNYFSPKKYVQMLETYFQCNIILFDKERIFLPDYLQNYYKKENKNPFVFVYEHYGSESDHARYPQCELIIRWKIDKSDDIEYFYDRKDAIGKIINKMNEQLYESYALNNKVESIKWTWPSEIEIVSQTIDSYGKCRRIDTETMSVFVSPIQPLNVVENDSEITISSYEQAIEFFNKLNIKPHSQTLYKDRIRQINSYMGNIRVSVPVNTDIIDENLKIDSDLSYTESKISDLEIYNKNKKLVRYIVEYVFWMFSNYINEEAVSIITDKIINKFATKRVVLIENYEYENIDKNFSMKSSVIKDGKLIVQSEEMLKRLIYVLKLYSIRNLQSLLNYHKRKVITNYYVDITDFDKYDNEIILYGEDAIDKLIQDIKMVQIIHEEIVIGKLSPYFFKNKLIENRVFLAQNSNSISRALSICLEWQQKGYNNPNSEMKDVNYAYSLYAYKNKDDITKYEIKGKNSEEEIIILGYKLSGTPFFTSLLPL